MSTVSNVGSTSVDLYQLLQQTAGQASSATPVTAATSDGQDGQDGQVNEAAQGGHHHHHHLRNQIESAVTNALQSSNGSSDPNQIVQKAIAGVLSANQNASATDPNASASTQTPNPAGNSPTANQAAFTQLLQSYGIDPQQFQKDFQAAVQQSQANNSNIDPSQLFNSFPPGSGLDTTA